MKVPAFPSAELLVFWGGWQTGFNGFAHNPRDYAKHVTCPILFLHGGEDPLARSAEARAVFDAVSGPREFKEFPQAAHEAMVVRFPAEWRACVARFLSPAGAP